jgi:hypothetical protein
MTIVASKFFVQNTQNNGMLDKSFEVLVKSKTFIETCSFPRSHALRYDQQKKDKAKKLVNATS